MLEKHPLSDLTIISYLKTHYGIPVTTLTFLPIGADIHSSIYKAQTRDQTSYFIKLKQGHHHDSIVEIVEFLQHAGIQQVIPAIKTVDGKLTQLIEGFTLIVYPFVEGKEGFSCDLTDDQWVKLGTALRQIHEVKLPLSIQNRIRRETYSSKWRDSMRSTCLAIESIQNVDEIALQLQKFVKKHMLAIHRLVDRAELLAEKLQKHSPPFILCHSDIHAGNVLIQGKDEIYIVDWDEPILAPKERDLMFIGGGVGNVWNKPHEEKLFYQGYGKTQVDPTVLSYYRQERIVEDIAVYCQELLLTKKGGKNRAEMYKHFLDMFASNGVVEIAFQTDEALKITSHTFYNKL